MSELLEIAEKLKLQIRNPRSRCLMPSSGGYVGESSLMGTRDAYLQLIVSLLEFVGDADEGRAEFDQDTQAHWDDRFKTAMLQLPNSDAWLCGAYLFKNEQDLMRTLRNFTEWDGTTSQSIDNDPDFDME